MHLTAVRRRRRNRRWSVAIRCRARHTVITLRIAAKPCHRCMLLLCSPPPCMAFPTLPCVRSAASDWQVSRSRFFQSRDCGPLPRSADLRVSGPVAPSRLVCPPVGSRLEAFVCFDIPVSTGGTVCENTKSIFHPSICACSPVAPPLLCVSEVKAQGPAPETAPPLFPGGGLISYNSIFTTRSLMPGVSSGIPVTAFPTFSHEADFNFTWGFYRNFDLTVLIPVVTNHFDTGSGPAVGGNRSWRCLVARKISLLPTRFDAALRRHPSRLAPRPLRAKQI